MINSWGIKIKTLCRSHTNFILEYIRSLVFPIYRDEISFFHRICIRLIQSRPEKHSSKKSPCYPSWRWLINVVQRSNNQQNAVKSEINIFYYLFSLSLATLYKVPVVIDNFMMSSSKSQSEPYRPFWCQTCVEFRVKKTNKNKNIYIKKICAPLIYRFDINRLIGHKPNRIINMAFLIR